MPAEAAGEVVYDKASDYDLESRNKKRGGLSGWLKIKAEDLTGG